MKTIAKRGGLPLVVAVMLLNIFLISLHAIEFTTAFFPSDRIPKEYFIPNNGDLTLVRLKNWPADSTISVSETRLLGGEHKERGKIPPSKDRELLHLVYSIGYLPGEPVRFTFQDRLKKLSRTVTIVPFPLCAASTVDNAKVEAKISKMMQPYTYTIEFSGLGEKEVLLMESRSYDEKIKTELTNPQQFTFIPGVAGKIGGLAQLSFQRASGEILKLELPWGVEVMKYFVYDDNGQAKSLVDRADFRKEYPQVYEYFNP